jgi:hypothetical protein
VDSIVCYALLVFCDEPADTFAQRAVYHWPTSASSVSNGAQPFRIIHCLYARKALRTDADSSKSSLSLSLSLSLYIKIAF